MEGDEFGIAVSATVDAPSGPVEVLPVLPSLFTSSPARPAAAVAPVGDGQIQWSSRHQCRASGTEELGVVFFRLWDHAGLWVAESRHEQRATVTVYPQATLIRSLPKPRLTGAPFGIHSSRRLGDGTDFADIRQFAPGDQVRHVNWPVSLRMRRLHINQFYTERSGEIIILIDSFSNIGLRPNASLDHCRRAAASLAMGYLRQHDRLGLMDYGGWIHTTRPAAGPRQYAVILQSLARISIAPSQFLQDLTTLPEPILPWHALIIALTPLADPRFAQMVGRLAEQGRDVVLLALRTDEICADLAPAMARGKLARRLWLLEREQQLRELRRHGVRAVQWAPTLPIETALMTVQRPRVARQASW
jgi:uncharacterized protein (DUF58 family)